MWRVNNKLLKTSWVKEDITWEVKGCIKTEENANRSYQNFDLKTIFLKMATMGPFISLNSSLFYYRCSNISLFPYFMQSTPPPHSPSTHHCPCPWVTQTCSLPNPIPSSPPFPYSLSSGSCQTVPCLHVSGSVLFFTLFCSLHSS